jgi:hypothetical protein
VSAGLAGRLCVYCGANDGWCIVRRLEQSVLKMRGLFSVLVVLLARPLSLTTVQGVPLHPKLARQQRRTLLGCVGRSGWRWSLPEGEGRARCSTGYA